MRAAWRIARQPPCRRRARSVTDDDRQIGVSRSSRRWRGRLARRRGRRSDWHGGVPLSRAGASGGLAGTSDDQHQDRESECQPHSGRTPWFQPISLPVAQLLLISHTLRCPLLMSSLLLLDSPRPPPGESPAGYASKSIGGFFVLLRSRRAKLAVVATTIAVGALLTLGEFPAAYAVPPEPTKPASPAPIPSRYIVTLTDKPIATYDGDVNGLGATRPSKGARVNVTSGRAERYRAYLEKQQENAAARVGAQAAEALRGQPQWVRNDTHSGASSYAATRTGCARGHQGPAAKAYRQQELGRLLEAVGLQRRMGSTRRQEVRRPWCGCRSRGFRLLARKQVLRR